MPLLKRMLGAQPIVVPLAEAVAKVTTLLPMALDLIRAQSNVAKLDTQLAFSTTPTAGTLSNLRRVRGPLLRPGYPVSCPLVFPRWRFPPTSVV